MSTPNRLITGMPFPAITLPTTDGTSVVLGERGWRAIFVIRGAHCPICRAYLGQLESKRVDWESRGIEVLVVSADPIDRSRQFMKEAGYHGRAAGGLDVPAMRALGLWMTGPDRSSVDYVHPEPGFFLIDPDGHVAAAEASTLPSVRPDLAWLDRGLAYIIEHDVRPPSGRYGHSASVRLRRSGETILLTGATGYVGSVVAETLHALGYTIRGLTRSERSVPGLEAKGIEPVVGDVADADLMARAAQGVRAIVHTASPGPPAPGESMEQVIARGVRAVISLADIAAANHARLVVTSGATLYGHTQGQVVDETTPLRAPPFAAQFAEAEHTLAEEGRAYILRLGVVYGREPSASMRALVERIRERGAPAIVEPANRPCARGRPRGALRRDARGRRTAGGGQRRGLHSPVAGGDRCHRACGR